MRHRRLAFTTFFARGAAEAAAARFIRFGSFASLAHSFAPRVRHCALAGQATFPANIYAPTPRNPTQAPTKAPTTSPTEAPTLGHTCRSDSPKNACGSCGAAYHVKCTIPGCEDACGGTDLTKTTDAYCKPWGDARLSSCGGSRSPTKAPTKRPTKTPTPFPTNLEKYGDGDDGPPGDCCVVCPTCSCCSAGSEIEDDDDDEHAADGDHLDDEPAADDDDSPEQIPDPGGEDYPKGDGGPGDCCLLCETCSCSSDWDLGGPDSETDDAYFA